VTFRAKQGTLNTSGKMSPMIPRFATEKEHQWQNSS
jgi:hypothetical protein